PDAFVAAPRPASGTAGASGRSAASGLSRVTGGSGVTGASGTPGSGASRGVGAGRSGVSDGTPSTPLAPTVIAGEAATDGKPAGDAGAAAPFDAAGRPAEPAWHELVAAADDAEPFLYTTGSYAAPAPLPNPWATSGPQPPVVAEPV